MVRFVLGILAVVCLWPVVALGEKISTAQEDYIRANTIFFIYHELGHALIDLQRLPVFGQEEDAADVLGDVLSEKMNSEEDNAFIMLAAADNFAYMAGKAEDEGQSPIFWDTHGLDQQRYYTLDCLHYGADPAARAGTADKLELPEDRRQTCPSEFQLAEESWGPVLDEVETEKSGGSWISLSVLKKPRTEAEAMVLDAVITEVEILNDFFDAGIPLGLSFDRCGQANAFYDPNTQHVTICAELAELFLE